MKSNKYQLVFHVKAISDYDHAYYWYELQEQGLGERFIKMVSDKLQHIINNPETYGTGTKKQYREAKITDFPYAIVYKINIMESIIFVSSIHHEKKHPNKKFRK